MKDLETRLRDSLAARAEDAPSPPGLGTRARDRLRRRRTAMAKAVAGAAAAVAVIAAVPAGVALADRLTEGAGEAVLALGDGEGSTDEGRPTPAAKPTPFIVPDLSADLAPKPRAAPDSVREVTWFGLSFVVPTKWKDGATTAWCAKGGAKGGAKVGAEDAAAMVPRVDLPDEARPATVCSPTMGYGVTLRPNLDFESTPGSRMVRQYDAAVSADDPPAYPDGAWVASWYDEEWVVTVATTDPGLASQVVRSVTAAEVDVNGCALLYDESALESAVGPRGVGASRCSYTAAGLLEDSERLTARETGSALAALAAAPAALGGGDCEQVQGWLVSLTPAGESAWLARYDTQGLGSCQDGVEVMGADGDYVTITPDVVEALDLDQLAPDD